jgi:hypothetical protein
MALRGCAASRSGSPPLFSDITTEDWIPKGHPLRKVQRLADPTLARLNPTFCRALPRRRQPWIPLEQLLLQAIYGIRSEQMLIEYLGYNLIFPLVCRLQPG